jgi:hypothetical protein
MLLFPWVIAFTASVNAALAMGSFSLITWGIALAAIGAKTVLRFWPQKYGSLVPSITTLGS